MLPLLLLHGFGGGPDDWRHVFADLDDLERSRRVLRPPSRGFWIREAADDLLALLDRERIERACAIGMSLGGNTLLHVATRHPDRIAAMVLVSATTHFGPEAKAILRASEHAQPRAWADADDDMAFTPADLARITARTRIVYGDRDPLYPIEIAVAMYRAIPDAELAVVPGAGHGPIFGEYAPAFARDALAFLDRDAG